MYELALFSGAGGGILGTQSLGFKVVCGVEIEKYPRSILQARQADGFLPPFPIWDDIRTFSEKNPQTTAMFNQLKKVRKNLVITGGFPCQDISVAGSGAGIDGKKSKLIWEYLRVVNEIRPAYFFLENSPNFVNRGFDRVLGRISEMGYDARWIRLGATDVGAPHKRKRLWLLAYPSGNRGLQDPVREFITTNKSSSRLFLQEWRKKGMANSNKIRLQHTRKSRERRGAQFKNRCNLGHSISQRLAGFSRNEFCSERWETENGSPLLPSVRWWDIDPADLPYSTGQGLPQRTTGESGEIWETKQPQRCDQSKGEMENPPLYGFDESEWGAESNSRDRLQEREKEDKSRWPVESRVGRVADGVARRVDRIKAIGNGQVSAVVMAAWYLLGGPIPERKV